MWLRVRSIEDIYNVKSRYGRLNVDLHVHPNNYGIIPMNDDMVRVSNSFNEALAISCIREWIETTKDKDMIIYIAASALPSKYLVRLKKYFNLRF